MVSEKLREDFPRLQRGDNLIYFDNASTSLKPRKVIKAVVDYYENVGGNTGRGTHKSSQKAAQLIHEAREKIANFINANNDELVFTRNCTESINICAVSLERMGHFNEGDEIVISSMEHHSNLVPWQELCKRTGAKLKIVSHNKDFTLNMQDLEEKVTRKTKLVSMTHVANTLGTILPVKEIGKVSHDNNSLFLVDAAQSVSDFEIDVKKIDADFLVFSGHKMLGPTGVGCFYAKKDLLEKMPPYNLGGGIITKVEYKKTSFLKGFESFETGTLPIAQIIGLGSAVDYLEKVGMENIHEHDQKLLRHAFKKMDENPHIMVYGTRDENKQRGILLFEVSGVDPIDLATALDETKNIAIRSGMHCAEPIVSSINKHGLCRASFYLYNTIDEINIFTDQATAISKSIR